MSKKLQSLLLIIIMLAVLVPTTLAAPPAQEEGQDYIVVADDWLSKLADKYLGNSLAYPTIVYYTNQKNAEDASYANITDANLIEVGWKIYIPSAAEAEAYLTPTAAEATEAVLPDIGTIRIGHLPQSGHARTFVALDKGYFAEQGLEVELHSFRSAALMIAPLSAGQLDVGAGGPSTALFNAISQGLDVRAVAGTSSHRGDVQGIFFMVRKDLYDAGEITEPADLKGRKIGVNVPHGLAEYFVAAVLAQGDLTVDDVELVSMPFPEIPAALANKALDAAYLSTVFKDKAVADGSAIALLKVTDILDPYQTGMLYFGKRFLDPANREVAVRVLVAYLKATRELYPDGFYADENLAITHKYTDIPIERLRTQELSYNDLNLLVVQSSVEKTQAYFVNRGYTDYAEPLPFEQWYDTSFLEEALARVGRVGDY